ncbi:uncharacterized protein V1510DRAFT_378208 [Dipodascopsis tothii]|uniref:uncharacterized protein n=1 Tax=Dipodascopsis tothii TaxID=44089 RepID=UPI0034CE8993
MPSQSVQQFLAGARQYVSKRVAASRTLLVAGNASADLDSFTSSLVFAYLSQTKERFQDYKRVLPLFNIPREEVALRPELLHLLANLRIPSEDVICLDEYLEYVRAVPEAKDSTDIVLVDHNNLLAELGELYGDRVVGIIDHHQNEGKPLPANLDPELIRFSGSCSSLVVRYFDEYWTSACEFKKDVATLALGAVLIDTSNLTAKETEDDIEAARLLLEALGSATTVTALETGSFRDTFYRDLHDAKNSVDSFSLRDLLRKDYKEWTEANGIKLGTSSSVKSLAWTSKKFGDGFLPGLRSWAAERKLDMFMAMTSYVDADGAFRRDLLMLNVNPALLPTATQFAAAAETEFKTVPFDTADPNLVCDADAGYWCWDQRELKASRKQVAPAMRQTLQAAKL